MRCRGLSRWGSHSVVMLRVQVLPLLLPNNTNGKSATAQSTAKDALPAQASDITAAWAILIVLVVFLDIVLVFFYVQGFFFSSPADVRSMC